MGQKQKRIVAALVAANVIVILGLVLWVSLTLNTESSSVPTQSTTLTGSELKVPAPTTFLHETCQWKAARLFARAGLDGAVALTSDGLLRFDVTYPLAPGQAVDEAAQSIWLAFDVALALLEDECDLFTQVEVIVLAQGNQALTRISARVDTADLVAFDVGELTEDAFTQRVVYQIGDE
jgi:hypothetical protein